MNQRGGKLPGEFELIERLCGHICAGSRTILGPGDDCAILAPSRRPILFTIDAMVEGVHFGLRWASPEVLGARALTVNLSDIAAMGGRPTACVVNLAVRKGISLPVIDGLYAGLRRAARESAVDIVGGNITSSRELSLTIALLGEVGSATMRRDTAKVGDEVFVTGTLGDAALGWRILAGKLRVPAGARKHLIARCVRPTARIFAGQRLAATSPTPAAIDVSDGLIQDLRHILERSDVGAEIDAAALPLSAAYHTAVGSDLSYAMNGGEDYELLFCVRPGHSEAGLSRRLRLQVRRIGKIVRGRRLKISGADAAALAGWDHLRTGRSGR
ncbi:MAG TPA: thiamine-phosphate kinase [Candidatus Binataceae bacterium]|nr:thiamine-phosphate kinase [Candidatus Binataceae bacterium]